MALLVHYIRKDASWARAYFETGSKFINTAKSLDSASKILRHGVTSRVCDIIAFFSTLIMILSIIDDKAGDAKESISANILTSRSSHRVPYFMVREILKW
jgi:hypothetical protein